MLRLLRLLKAPKAPGEAAKDYVSTCCFLFNSFGTGMPGHPSVCLPTDLERFDFNHPYHGS